MSAFYSNAVKSRKIFLALFYTGKQMSLAWEAWRKYLSVFRVGVVVLRLGLY